MYQYVRGIAVLPNCSTWQRRCFEQITLARHTRSVPFLRKLVLINDHLADEPITAAQLKVWTAKYPFFDESTLLYQNGWPNTTGD